MSLPRLARHCDECHLSSCGSMQASKDVLVTIAVSAQVCAVVQDSLALLAVIATGAVYILPGTDPQTISTALTIGSDSASRCFGMLNNLLASAGHTQGAAITGA
jgi:hypothetical protein